MEEQHTSPRDDEPVAPAAGHRYDHLMPPQRPTHKVRNVLITAGTVLVVGAGIYLLFLRPAAPPPRTTSPSSGQSPSVSTPQPTDSTPKTYKSTVLGIELTHRADWQLAENTTAKELTLTSPPTEIVEPSGTASTGAFVLKLRLGTDEIAAKPILDSTAMLKSEVIGYTAPTETQRHYTSVTFAGSNDQVKFFIITGPNEFKPGDTLGGMFFNDETLTIIGGLAGADKNAFVNFKAVPKDSFTETDAYKEAIKVVESLKVY